MNAEDNHEMKLAPLVAGDELPAPAELSAISCFEGMKRAPNFEKLSNDFVLRRGHPGRVICEQGEAGSSAFYVLTRKDVLSLRTRQLEELQIRLEKLSSGSAQQDAETASSEKTELLVLEKKLKTELSTLSSATPLDQTNTDTEGAPVLSVHLKLIKPVVRNKPSGLVARIKGLFTRPEEDSPAAPSPGSIPIDAPAVLSSDKPSARLKEGDLFGEMSCMYRTPRSATVIVDEPCYVLEMLRNILDFLHKDPQLKARLDQQYCDRILESHLQHLSFFRGIERDKNALDQLCAMAKLVQFQAGDVVFEEFDASDAIYIVRRGLVKVVKNVGCQLRLQDIAKSQWEILPKELSALAGSSDPLCVATLAELNKHLTLSSESTLVANSEADREVILKGLNAFIRQGAVHKQLGKLKSEVLEILSRRQLSLVVESYPEKTENWSELEQRIFHRLLLEHCCPLGVPNRAVTTGAMRTISYLNQGDVLGEMGVVLNQLRSATCVAYDHPDGSYGMRLPDSRTGGVPSLLELVRIDRSDVEKLQQLFPELKERLSTIIAARQSQSVDQRKESSPILTDSFFSPEMEELGLIQGQNLMLIDLDRCTRCGACVEACVSAHKDGNTRLYLDGPRYGNYLVPLSCRKCQDPVCLIGCPVGAINRGDNGEIVVRDWCIGCSLCADQCPYGSIQMTEMISELNPTPGAKPDQSAVVCDMCSSSKLGQEACVYACPHDAAMRTNATTSFPI